MNPIIYLCYVLRRNFRIIHKTSLQPTKTLPQHSLVLFFFDKTVNSAYYRKCPYAFLHSKSLKKV